MKNPKIIPRGKYILVKPDEAEAAQQSASGLSVPANTDKEQRAQGVVEAVSKEIKDLKKGDVIIYGAYAGENVEFMDGAKKVELKLLHDDDIIATVE